MKLVYENDVGKVELYGGKSNGFSISETEGLELLGRERSLVSFYNSDGYRESQAKFGQRVITVSGDIAAKSREEQNKAIKVFSHPGTLTVHAKDTARMIDVNDTVFKFGVGNGTYRKFVVQFTCDNPHFTDCADTVTGVYARKDLLMSETVLPSVFTERTSHGTANNDGDLAIEPIIVIKCLTATDDADRNIIIENTANGAKLVINHAMKSGEIVTVDIPEREITSSTDGNILKSLAAGSYLSNMRVERGENNIRVTVGAGNRNAEVYLKYRNHYTGVIA